MRITLLFPVAFLLIGCGSGVDDVALSNEAEAVSPSENNATAQETAPNLEVKDLPWGMPHMPNARYIHMIDSFTRPIGPHGGEATALIAYRGSPREIVEYYDAVATENGFTTTIAPHSDEKSANLSATDSEGKVFYVSAKKGGRKADEGESSATLVFQLPK